LRKLQNFKNAYLGSLFDVQGFLDEAALVCADLRISTGCVEGSGVSTMVVAKLARVSNPIFSCAGD
jgi:hypothetical protein